MPDKRSFFRRLLGRTFLGGLRKKLHLQPSFTDALARQWVRLAGATIIFAIFLVFAVLIGECYPLFFGMKIKPVKDFPGTRKAVLDTRLTRAWMLDDYGEHLAVLTREGEVNVLSALTFMRVQGPDPLGLGESESIVHASVDPWTKGVAMMTSLGRILTVQFEWSWLYEGTQRRLGSLKWELREWSDLQDSPERVMNLVYRGDMEHVGAGSISVLYPNRWILFRRSQETSLFGEGEWRVQRLEAPLLEDYDDYTRAEVSDKWLLVGTRSGRLHVFRLVTNPEFTAKEVQVIPIGQPITALRFLIGKNSVGVGTGKGSVQVWFPVSSQSQGEKFQRIHDFGTLRGAVVDIIPDSETRAFFTMSEQGELGWHHSTAGRTRWRKQPFGNVHWLDGALDSRRTRMFARDTGGRLFMLAIRDRHPEISWKALFGRNWYEGYDHAQYMWQSSSGHQSFEAKFSLVPLIFGTLKGTVYALFIALPLALFGALYMGQFLHPSLRIYLKPVIELMAGLPSVVLGFIGGLWLAPQLEKWFPAVIILPVMIGIGVFTAPWVWSLFHWKQSKGSFRDLVQFLFLSLWITGLSAIPFLFNETINKRLLAGNYQQWFYQMFGWTYEQRNALAVGLVMGYAVIPVVFSITEDAISAVPREWTAGSLALGATQWQTLMHVVVPASLSGIMSAIMVGFGRAVGETMIVLMATGNTPVLDPSPFSGFRTLSANLAVELPEAPYGSTHYRILFLSALLLFLFTMVLNTLAEVFRERVRRRYYRK